MSRPYTMSLPDLRKLSRYPIYQAPTGSIAGPELAAAVCAGGGVGAMALTWTDPGCAAQQVIEVRDRTDAPFLVNYALAFPPTSLAAALAAGAPIVSFSWGDPTPYLHQVHAAGALCGVQVTNALGAREYSDKGFDFLICQGDEAGGHVQANRSLWHTLPGILQAAGNTPVIASGGIGCGQQIAQALLLGAAGAMLGTRFVATIESRAHSDYKRMLVEKTSEDTALTVCFDGGWTYAAHRIVRNTTLEAWEAAGSPPPGRRPGEGDVVGHSADGEPIARYSDIAPRQGFIGDPGAMCCYAGTSISSISDLPAAAALTERLWAECRKAMEQLVPLHAS